MRKFRWLAMGLAVVAFSVTSAQAQNPDLPTFEIIWDGGDGNWEDENWNGGQTAESLTGRVNGSRGWASPATSDMNEHIIINDGTVNYDGDALQEDFQVYQGGLMTISNGATWIQSQSDDWSENRWTEFDGSVLNLDGGHFVKEGEGPGDGGGALLFGSWKGNDTFSEPEDINEGRQIINVNITNGGSIRNHGELWIAIAEVGGDQWGNDPGGFEFNMEINNGSIDVTTSSVISDDELPLAGELIIGQRKLEGGGELADININFTGPGSITLGEQAIAYIEFDTDGAVEADTISYEQLWDLGILQANGVSGDGGNFGDFFSVTGNVGEDGYMLTSLLTGLDLNGDGTVNVSDIDLVALGDTETRDAILAAFNADLGDVNNDRSYDSDDLIDTFAAGHYNNGEMATYTEGDTNLDGVYDSDDLIEAFAQGSYNDGAPAATAAVPEPASATLAAFAALAMLGFVRRR